MPKREGYIWSPSHWEWNGRRHVWNEGHWVKDDFAEQVAMYNLGRQSLAIVPSESTRDIIVFERR
jgi:hypothetical protein